MDVWDQIDLLLHRYEHNERHRAMLKRLVSRLPPDIASVTESKRARAQAIGAEALYHLGEVERLLAWAVPPLTPAAALWVAYTLFDLSRFSEALPYQRWVLKESDLQDWARCKLNECVLCCRIHVEPATVTLDDISVLHTEYQSLGIDAPVPVELHRALAYAEESGALPGTLIAEARELFMDTFREWSLDKK